MDLEYALGDTIPAPPACERCATLERQAILAAQVIEQLRAQVASLVSAMQRPLPEGM